MLIIKQHQHLFYEMSERSEEKEVIFDFIQCPHCDGLVVCALSELNCRIFRHGILKSTGQQINPHANREECLELVNQNQLYGCGGPFRVTGEVSGSLVAEKCEYI